MLLNNFTIRYQSEKRREKETTLYGTRVGGIDVESVCGVWKKEPTNSVQTVLYNDDQTKAQIV